MATSTTYLTTDFNGDSYTSTNVLGAPDDVWTTNTGNTDFTFSWSFDAFVAEGVDGDLTITITYRRDAADGGDPNINRVEIIQNTNTILTLTENQVPSADGLANEYVFTVANSLLEDEINPITVEVIVHGVGGNPSDRRTTQLDAMMLEYDFTPAGGTILNYWTGSAWSPKPVKKYNGATWEDATLQKWNGSIWVDA